MKERITMQKLIQEGWIPLLTGILSAGVILSLAHSTGMAYVAALMLITLYFVVISANRVSAILAVIIDSLRHQAISKIKAIFFIDELTDWRKNFVPVSVHRIDSLQYHVQQDMGALFDYIAQRLSTTESILKVLMDLTQTSEHDGLTSRHKPALDRIIKFLKFMSYGAR